MIKACFFDVDGTLVSHRTHSVPESTIKSLLELREKGIKIVISTGRYLDDLKKLPVMQTGVPFDGYLTLNGQLCLDENFKYFAGNPIPQADTEMLLRMFEAEQIPLVVINEEGKAANIVNQRVIDTQNATMGEIPTIAAIKGEKIYQVISFVSPHQKELLKQFLEESEITSWNENAIDIIAKGAGKDLGIQRFIDKEGIRRSEIMSFGDGENDVGMLKFAGIGVAMGNGCEKAKEAADYVTTDIDDNGIRNALEHFGVIGEQKSLHYSIKEDNKVYKFVLNGALDTTSAPTFEKALMEIIDEAEQVIMNCANLNYISSIGLRTILAAQKILSKKGIVMQFLNVNDTVKEVFEITGFSSLIQIVE